MLKLLMMGFAGFGVYMLAKQRESSNPSLPFSPVSPAGTRTGAQPSQMYPFRAPAAVRVDNANQPWYAGSRQAMQGPADSVTAVDMLQQGATVIHSMSDIWGTMSEWFGANTDGDSYDLSSADAVDGLDWGDMAGGAMDSSNVVGDELYDEFDPSYSNSDNWDVA